MEIEDMLQQRRCYPVNQKKKNNHTQSKTIGNTHNERRIRYFDTLNMKWNPDMRHNYSKQQLHNAAGIPTV